MRSYTESIGELMLRLGSGSPPARPIVYKGNQMRSHLEARFAMHLDDLGEAWVYEPRVYGGKGGYLPDFEILGGPQRTFIEVKPTLAEAPVAQLKMAVVWKTHPDALLIVCCEEARTFFRAYYGQPWFEWQERWA